ncbi:MAG: hypothetical protein KDC12_13545 [Flavobacteriales bacterium]|nr:hypothetical protein [Flavobacteriales bacterium]
MKKTSSYLKELAVVTIGVLIALLLNNWKESREARQFYEKSLITVQQEMEENQADLSFVLNHQMALLDTVQNHLTDSTSVSELIQRAGGLKSATIRNVGLDIYARNDISNLDYATLSRLMQMKSLSGLIDNKMNKLMDFIYPNTFERSSESKELLSVFLSNLIESEAQLNHIYLSFRTEKSLPNE